MNVVIRISEADRARAWGLLARHSPGTALPNGMFIITEGAARALRSQGIDFSEISREGRIAGPAGVPAGERI